MKNTNDLVDDLRCSIGSVQRSRAAENGNKVKPGELIIDHPTLINLGFEWLIEGDDNHNAQVEVSYRKQGETQWKQGLPLLRLHGETDLPEPGCV